MKNRYPKRWFLHIYNAKKYNDEIWFTNIITSTVIHYLYTQCTYTICVRTRNVSYQINLYKFRSISFRPLYISHKIQLCYTIYSLFIQRDCKTNFPYFINSTQHPVCFWNHQKQECIAHGNPHTISRICTRCIYHVTFLRREQNKIEKKNLKCILGKHCVPFPLVFRDHFQIVATETSPR